MKKMALLASALCLTAGAQAAEVGMGVTLNSWDNDAIFIPINVTKELRLEPYFSVYKYSTNVKGGPDSEYRYYSLGLGAYNIRMVTDNVNVIIGGRAGYIDSKDDNYSGTTTGHGYGIAPVLGFEYFPVKNVSVGADASLEYYHVSYSGGNGRSSTDTVTNITVKYFFN